MGLSRNKVAVRERAAGSPPIFSQKHPLQIYILGMSSINMQKKFFTIEETNKAIPKIKNFFDRIFFLQKQIKESKLITQEIFDMLQEIEINIEKINQVGCVVKDAKEGLVDFYHIMEKGTVFLCWKYGEDEVKNWHGLSEGFQGRKPLEKISIS